ncbi:MAG TPA: hypothetical protein VNT99_20850 [Methylomirabilota bacterium]|nr:hypothetical protein [Methylomirabilota bacterium]
MEALLDACPPIAALSSRPHLFTTANAKEMSARGNAAKAFAKKAREVLLAKANEIAAMLPDEICKSQRLARVRKQLEKIDDMIEKERDPQKLDRLASVQARLSVQEFALAGRPMPGSRRPGRDKSKPVTQGIEPTE